MHHLIFDSVRKIQQLCPLQCSLADCLNLLRTQQIPFLNLGNLIICPDAHCLLIFHMKKLRCIDNYTKTA